MPQGLSRHENGVAPVSNCSTALPRSTLSAAARAGPQPAMHASSGADARVVTAQVPAPEGPKSNFADVYDLGEQLGAGSFGTVHKVFQRSTGEGAPSRGAVPLGRDGSRASHTAPPPVAPMTQHLPPK